MTDLTIDRTLAFPVERVWRAMTDPAALTAWFWPRRFDPTVEVDLRVGGRYRIDGPAVGMAVSGEYVAVEPPHRLVFTWLWDGEDAETLVTVELTPTADGTRLVLRHERFVDDEAAKSHAQGWDDCLDRLPAWLTHSTE
ncbi:SRPBCC domain-containing protein [Virgisporangium ochraceum]|uniref:Activator of HSP90 ATPase n=1 Tax=Virgisporangium ochraceum TaxID=65505 RepID=A0A8J4ED13_9ACTN|nr:SRPBCC domain-containing protein [Virgisporangium ochraceum]GIJ67467.1 activator of HSP90 ATPase [Virgisporangium ochraceum]